MIALASVALLACGDSAKEGDDEVGETAAPETDSETETEGTTETQGTEATETTTEGSETTGAPAPCDMFAQDCPEGQKCVTYWDGGWQPPICVDVVGDTPYGEPCTHDGVNAPQDTCDADSWCFGFMRIEGEDVGTCTPFCLGDAEMAECPEGYACQISAEGPAVCIDTCDPLLQNCPPLEACYWTNTQFACLPGGGVPLNNVPCMFTNDCMGGSLCLTGELFNLCEGANCCAEYCSIAGGDGPCTEEEDAHVCVPFFEEGRAPEGWEDVGVCILPQP
ncbi:hypothetical protein PPSIR1_38621 [Plesiocystis pacifica SIR-1]|uniref:Uncharacterized protein n=1 Tax=Plesiocystis pacifica SIR-1 TaxID=391625 RepID=A6G8P7_9BACT|nr:hypothetical protein [Plesiocystis pacifica]EDM77707.1 hypothetical protein PPSIR1_38621 [Plesiocystis pacifica SIR-1]